LAQKTFHIQMLDNLISPDKIVQLSSSDKIMI
jgi:hypothetical protein